MKNKFGGKYDLFLIHNENFAEIINDIKNAYSIKLNDSSANLSLGYFLNLMKLGMRIQIIMSSQISLKKRKINIVFEINFVTNAANSDLDFINDMRC